MMNPREGVLPASKCVLGSGERTLLIPIIPAISDALHPTRMRRKRTKSLGARRGGECGARGRRRWTSIYMFPICSMHAPSSFVRLPGMAVTRRRAMARYIDDLRLSTRALGAVIWHGCVRIRCRCGPFGHGQSACALVASRTATMELSV